jgi:hypothetical protein
MADWLEYDWTFEKKPAHVTVDMSLADTDRALRPMLVWCAFSSLDAKFSSSSAPADIRRLSKAGKALVRAMPEDMLYAGNIRSGSELSLYFYGSGQHVPEKILKIGKADKHLSFESGVLNDPDWSYYAKLLYPDAARLPTVAKIDLLDRMRRLGDYPAALHMITNYIFFPSEPLCLQFMEAARLDGFIVGDTMFIQEHEPPHGVLIRHRCALTPAGINDMTTRLITICLRYGGAYETWNAPVMKKNPLG